MLSLLILSDETLTNPLSVLPTDINMEGPSSSTLDDLRRQLHKYNKLAEAEIDKGAGRDKDLVAELQKERELLGAEIDRLTPGEAQYHEACAVLSKHHLHQAAHLHQHAYSCDHNQGFMLALCHCGPPAQAWLFAVFCNCKHLQLLGCCMPWSRPLWQSCAGQYMWFGCARG